jgi:ABC-type phosphate transport system substrate-binding protein
MAHAVRFFLCTSLLIAACHDRAPSAPITIFDGSSTAFPLAEAVAQEYMKANRGATMGMAHQLAEQRLQKKATGTMFKAPNAAELGVEYLLTQ